MVFHAIIKFILHRPCTSIQQRWDKKEEVKKGKARLERELRTQMLRALLARLVRVSELRSAGLMQVLSKEWGGHVRLIIAKRN
jgi:hypothetical protein